MSLTVLLAWWAIAGVVIPERAGLAAIPWWAWAGGGLQGLTIFAVFATAGVTGTVFFSALTVTGGAITWALLGNYGLAGLTQHPFT